MDLYLSTGKNIFCLFSTTMKKTTKKIKNIKISVESHKLLKNFCDKKGYKIYGYLEELIRNNCVMKTDLYGDPLE